jgi:hypothetical protein
MHLDGVLNRRGMRHEVQPAEVQVIGADAEQAAHRLPIVGLARGRHTGHRERGQSAGGEGKPGANQEAATVHPLRASSPGPVGATRL